MLASFFNNVQYYQNNRKERRNNVAIKNYEVLAGSLHLILVWMRSNFRFIACDFRHKSNKFFRPTTSIFFHCQQDIKFSDQHQHNCRIDCKSVVFYTLQINSRLIQNKRLYIWSILVTLMRWDQIDDYIIIYSVFSSFLHILGTFPNIKLQ